jgi:hypothetical protein
MSAPKVICWETSDIRAIPADSPGADPTWDASQNSS